MSHLVKYNQQYPCNWERLKWCMQLCMRFVLTQNLSFLYFSTRLPAIRSSCNYKRKTKRLICLLVHSKWLINSNKITECVIKSMPTHTNIKRRTHTITHKWKCCKVLLCFKVKIVSVLLNCSHFSCVPKLRKCVLSCRPLLSTQ